MNIETLPIPSITGYTWRPARLEDAEAILQLLLAVEAFDQRGSVPLLDDILRNLEDPEINLETDTLLGLTPEGQVIASGAALVPLVGETEYIAFLSGEIHPQHRTRGLGGALLTWMEARSRQILATRPKNLPHCLRISCHDFLKDRIALFEQHGFQHVRSMYRMRRYFSQPIPTIDLPEGITLRLWSPDLDRATFEAFNEAFRDHWGVAPLPEQIWQMWFTGHPHFRPDLSRLAMEGDQLVGFCLNKVHVEQNQAIGIQEGWIEEVGVLRPWRKRGIATALLCESMHAFKAAGLEAAGLGVDTENLTGALRIYERLGFEVVKRSMIFSKPVE
jgi:mycothiol synthase